MENLYYLIDSILRLLWDYGGWWFVFMFVGFCITDVIVPKEKKGNYPFEDEK